MSYYEIYNQYKGIDLDKKFREVRDPDIEASLKADNLNSERLITLLSPQAQNHLEAMAQKARDVTLRYFGKVIQLYTPLYLSNYCDNSCVYCGFNRQNNIERKKLDPSEVEREAQFIADAGLKHILILTGESRKISPVSYIKGCVKLLKKYFISISIEVYPLTEEEYAVLISEGVDSLTIYQETYDEELYAKMHLAGPKTNYCFRLDAPERGARAGMRNVNIGVLLGLGDWRKDVFSLGLHAKYLQDKFSDVDIGISIPRIRPQTGNFEAMHKVSDKAMAQIILALRLFLPRLGISLSTRENPSLRENLLPLGITRMSAGSTTRVGGHTIEEADNLAQFEISDSRTVKEIKAMLEGKGYQPVLKDWLYF
ncbi:MAG: 2-iminoacetate synthase ThiH [Candidatus Omnitrophota bacterium]|nr:2-iminoacetate synthase ThiH [Candidatus Omnitrophota bacterium]